MFGPIGGPELILILVLALLLFGPRKLPQIGRSIGKAMAEFRGVTNEFKATLDREVALDDLKTTQAELKSVAKDVDGAVRSATGGVARSQQPDRPTEPEITRPRDWYQK